MSRTTLTLLSVYFCHIGLQCAITANPYTRGLSRSRMTKEAVWCRYFERFRNGDPSNDPAPTIFGRHDGEDSRRLENYALGMGLVQTRSIFSSLKDNEWGLQYKIQYRRYGGDLQGVMDQLDYLQDLGVTAIFSIPSTMHRLCTNTMRNYHYRSEFWPQPQRG
ncbi:MAG: alpha-amylase family glycosyl hydrolase [Bacteroidia bacterium]